LLLVDEDVDAVLFDGESDAFLATIFLGDVDVDAVLFDGESDAFLAAIF